MSIDRRPVHHSKLTTDLGHLEESSEEPPASLTASSPEPAGKKQKAVCRVNTESSNYWQTKCSLPGVNRVCVYTESSKYSQTKCSLQGVNRVCVCIQNLQTIHRRNAVSKVLTGCMCVYRIVKLLADQMQSPRC